MSGTVYNPLQSSLSDVALEHPTSDAVASSARGEGTVSPLHATSLAPASSTASHGAHAHGEVVMAGGHATEPVAPTRMPPWLCKALEPIFKIQKRHTTIELEVYTGVVQFISCLYVLPVVPYQMKRVGYNETASIIATCVTCSIGSIIAAFLTDMPFIIAPPTSVSIFLAVSMQQSNMAPPEGNTAVIYSGLALTIVGAVPPISRFVTKLIPNCIQASTSVGIGLITALAGATEINLVVRGRYTIVDMGEITDEVIVAIAALIIVAAMLHYHVKGAFCSGLLFGTVVWWMIEPHDAPKKGLAVPASETGTYSRDAPSDIGLLIFNLLFLYILVLNGLSRAMSDLAGLTKPTGAIPRAGWLFIVCGLTTMLSGYFSGPPILISPESAAGIKAGAKTGLSTLVCGILFGVATFFYPIFAAVPATGTAPLLIMVGVLLFANVKRIDWTNYKESVPSYCVLFFIPFTYSILRGVAFGYIIYIFLGFYTGDFIENTAEFVHFYVDPCLKKTTGIDLIKLTEATTGMDINNDSLKKRLLAIEERERERQEEKDCEKERSGLFSRIMNSLDMESHDVEVGHMG